MLKPIDTSKYTQAALRNLGYLPPQRNRMAIGTIVAVNDSPTPLIVELDNGVVFKLGGLTECQTSQIPTLLNNLMGMRVAFNYECDNSHGQPVNPAFNTLSVKQRGVSK